MRTFDCSNGGEGGEIMGVELIFKFRGIRPWHKGRKGLKIRLLGPPSFKMTEQPTNNEIFVNFVI